LKYVINIYMQVVKFTDVTRSSDGDGD